MDELKRVYDEALADAKAARILRDALMQDAPSRAEEIISICDTINEAVKTAHNSLVAMANLRMANAANANTEKLFEHMSQHQQEGDEPWKGDKDNG